MRIYKLLVLLLITSTLAGISGTVSDAPQSDQFIIPLYIVHTPDSNIPVFRYQNETLPSSLKTDVEYIDFQDTTRENGQVFIYFTLPAKDASVAQSYAIGDFIVSREKWVGDRSRDSIAAEIYIHWIAENAKPFFKTTKKNADLYNKTVIGVSDNRPSPIHPTHLGYYYAGLKETDPMEAFLKNI